MELESLVKDLAARLGIEIELSEEGSFALEVDGEEVFVERQADGRSLSLLTRLGQPQPGPHEELYAVLLKANHLMLGTSGATLSIDPETNDVSLCRVLDLRAVDGDEFYGILERFVDAMDVWRKLTVEFRASEPTDEPTVSDSQWFTMRA